MFIQNYVIQNHVYSKITHFKIMFISRQINVTSKKYITIVFLKILQ